MKKLIKRLFIVFSLFLVLTIAVVSTRVFVAENTDNDILQSKTPLSTKLRIATLSQSSELYLPSDLSTPSTTLSIDTTTIVLIATSNDNPNYSVVCVDGNIYYTIKNNISPVNDGIPPTTNAKAYLKAKLYKYPILDDAYVLTTISKDTEFTLTGTVGGYDNNNWWSITYDNAMYYIRRTFAIGIQSTEETPRLTATVSTGSLNSYADIYSLADTSSGVISALQDGTQVKIYSKLSKADTFTKIYFEKNGEYHIGYVLTSQLTEGSTSNAQWIAILLIIVLTASTITTVTMISKHNKKRH